MDAVLHIEPIVRHTPTPLHVGHTDYISYGESYTDDDEYVGGARNMLQIGCPLESLDTGSTRSHVPIIKTVECSPDFTRDTGHVYSETLHYVKDKKFLIPFRSKIRSGLGQGVRLTHLPSLNEVRYNLTGQPFGVCDPRCDIISNLLSHEQNYDNQEHRYGRRQNQPLFDWIREDLTPKLSKVTTSDVSFSKDNLAQMIHRYGHQIHHTPNDLTVNHLKDIVAVVSPSIDFIPSAYFSHDKLQRHLLEFKDNLIQTDVNFRSMGSIPIHNLPNIDYNPFHFQPFCETLDIIPLTDFNVEIIVGSDFAIEYYHENIAVNRFSAFSDNEGGIFTGEEVVRSHFTPEKLGDLLETFVKHHSKMTPEIDEAICYNRVKVKIIKTITDEAAILIYPSNSTSLDPPLCGVYFDIALQSLAPLSITPERILR